MLLTLFLLAACGRSAPPVAPSSPQEGLVVQLPAGEGATLRVHRSGQGMDPSLAGTIVLAGETHTELAPGESSEFVFGVQPDALERVTIGSQAVLVDVPPGTTLSLLDHPCTGWTLSAPWLDANLVGSGVAACVAEDHECPDGMVPAPGPALALDPLCSADLTQTGAFQRCIRPPSITVQGTGASLRSGGPDGDIVERAITGDATLFPLGCGYPMVTTRTGSVALAAGPGQHWVLTVDVQGNISGVAQY